MCALTTSLVAGGNLLNDTVEWLRTAAAIMAGSEYGHIAGILFHPVECDLFSDLDAGSSRTSTSYILKVMATGC
jgi:hypothetical protein